MNKIIITLGSVTYATKVKRLLQGNGIPARVIKVDVGLSIEGCKFGVEIPYTAKFTAALLLKESGISYKIIER